MNKNRRILRNTACCMAAAITLGAAPSAVRADMPIAGAPAMMSIALEDEVKNTFQTADRKSVV